MANKGVPQLDAVTTLANADLFHVVVSNVDKKITTANLRTQILGTSTSPTIYSATVTIRPKRMDAMPSFMATHPIPTNQAAIVNMVIVHPHSAPQPATTARTHQQATRVMHSAASGHTRRCRPTLPSRFQLDG